MGFGCLQGSLLCVNPEICGKLLQLSVKEKHTAEDAESQAKDARQRAEVAVGEKNALKATLERQIAILEDKVCHPQHACNSFHQYCPDSELVQFMLLLLQSP